LPAATLKKSAGFTVVVNPAADDHRRIDGNDKFGLSGVATFPLLVTH
jgi:hypothetical protein